MHIFHQIPRYTCIYYLSLYESRTHLADIDSITHIPMFYSAIDLFPLKKVQYNLLHGQESIIDHIGQHKQSYISVNQGSDWLRKSPKYELQ